MHAAARHYVETQVAKHGPFVSVIEVGSRNINGSIRDLFGSCVYEGVDIVAGDGVDYVCDATVELPSGPYDCVVCVEVFEHLERWRLIVDNAASVLIPGGLLLLTMAGPGRPPHSAIDGAWLRPDEWYGNVDPSDLSDALAVAGFVDVEVDVDGTDVRAVARRGE